jgi:hypothetical protein
MKVKQFLITIEYTDATHWFADDDLLKTVLRMHVEQDTKKATNGDRPRVTVDHVVLDETTGKLHVIRM